MSDFGWCGEVFNFSMFNMFMWFYHSLLISEGNSFFFFLNFCRTHVLFAGPLIPLFWTSGDICPGFQSQGGFPHLRASSPVYNGFLRFTSGVTPAFSTNSGCTLYKHVYGMAGLTSLTCIGIWTTNAVVSCSAVRD